MEPLFANVRRAGGDAWDDVEDVEKEIEEMRGAKECFGLICELGCECEGCVYRDQNLLCFE